MKVKTLVVILLVFVLAFPFTGCKKVEKKHGAVGKMLPKFSLPDPLGKVHTSDEVVKGGLVLVVTAPTMHAEGAQKGWSHSLPATMPKGAHCVFLEDMDATAFKGMAKKEMRREFKEGDVPLLLLDEKGNLRSKLGVPKGETWVLAYNKEGELVYTDKGSAPSEVEAKAIWAKIK